MYGLRRVLTCPFCRRSVLPSLSSNLRRFSIFQLKPAKAAFRFQNEGVIHFARRSYSVYDELNAPKINMSDFPVENIRNFSIIAHVDHGKSTLADRLLEETGVINKSDENKQVLDKLQVERERGITVKAQTASLIYEYNGKTYLLNLIDTPGHVDFNYEVSRSLSACQGVILLIDANQGIQAQTVSNFYLAFESDLVIIPALNKIDLPGADPEAVSEQVQEMFDFSADEIYKVSAKKGTGVHELLQAVIEKVPPPDANPEEPFKALLFDSWFETYKGAIINIAVKDGTVKKGDKIMSAHTKKKYEVADVGVMHPNMTSTGQLFAGQVGYIVPQMKSSKEAHIGDTVHHSNKAVEPFPGFKPAVPMIFAGIFPLSQTEHPRLKTALEKLLLNDSSVDVNGDWSVVLGAGWRLGFLGLLHLDVFSQRLKQEFDADVIITTPSVPYKVKVSGTKAIKKYAGEEVMVLNPSQLPEENIEAYYEPTVTGTIMMPKEYSTAVSKLCKERRGVLQEEVHMSTQRVMCKWKLPLSEVIVDFVEVLKGKTSGYASFDYEDAGYQEAPLVKLDICLNGEEVSEFATIVHKDRARSIAQSMVTNLKETIPQQNFLVAIQGVVGRKVLARENIKPYKKDVTAKCYGGDITRRQKLLRKQAAFKKELRKIGKVEVPTKAFLSVMKR